MISEIQYTFWEQNLKVLLEGVSKNGPIFTTEKAVFSKIGWIKKNKNCLKSLIFSSNSIESFLEILPGICQSFKRYSKTIYK